jgi:hypothetical protein
MISSQSNLFQAKASELQMMEIKMRTVEICKGMAIRDKGDRHGKCAELKVCPFSESWLFCYSLYLSGIKANWTDFQPVNSE